MKTLSFMMYEIIKHFSVLTSAIVIVALTATHEVVSHLRRVCISIEMYHW